MDITLYLNSVSGCGEGGVPHISLVIEREKSQNKEQVGENEWNEYQEDKQWISQKIFG